MFVLGVTALPPLITSVHVLVNEQRVVRPGFLQTAKQNMIQLWDAIKQSNVFPPDLIYLLMATHTTLRFCNVLLHVSSLPLGSWSKQLVFIFTEMASFMPVLVLAARLFPEGMEATLFATLMSISYGGSVLGGLMGAGLTLKCSAITRDSSDNILKLIILCHLSSLLPLPLLGLVPKDSPETVAKDDVDIKMKSIQGK